MIALLVWLLRKHPAVASVQVITFADVERSYANHLENHETRVWS